jgi:hypothetical protein
VNYKQQQYMENASSTYAWQDSATVAASSARGFLFKEMAVELASCNGPA